ncbi:MAG: SusC/RagA family TonB-linked outer membrane protein [Saprospiraceae bacterium]
MKKLSLVFAMVLFAFQFAIAQRTITGTVTDTESGAPLISANVLVKGTSVGTVTDVDGKYSIDVPEGSSVLVFSYIGYSEKEATLGVENVVDVQMMEGVTVENVVVTALGISKSEKAIGYSVQEVGGEELVGANETNFVNSLSGKVAGLQITSSAGAAGASSFMTIRGINSISGNNQPLIVVDGIPIDNSQLRSGGATSSVALSNRAIDINQSEIENVSVLKGAAATALYGSQAGNGAIIITTKKGKLGKNKISVDFSTGMTISQISQTPELQTTYAQGRFGVHEGPHTGSGYSYGPRIDTMRFASGDYRFDPNGALVGQSDPTATSNPAQAYDRYNFFRTSISSRTNLAISAANKFSSIRFSVGYQNDQGIIPNNTFEKLNFGLNATSQLSEKVKLGVGVQYINSGGVRIEQGSNTSGVMLGLTRTSPTFDNTGGVEDPVNNSASYQFADGTQRNYRGGGGYDNPYWTINQNPLEDNVNRVIANMSLSYDPFEWLNITYRPGVDYYSDFREQFFAIGSRTNPRGQVLQDQYFVSNFYADLLATAKTDLTEDIGLSVTLGHNMRATTQNNLYSEANTLVIPNFYDLSNGSNLITNAEDFGGRTQAVFAMADVNYKSLFYLSLTGRLEEDSKLPIDNNQYFFYSASGSFVFSELIDNDVLSFGKLRASYGDVGLSAPFFYATDNYYEAADITNGWVQPAGVQYPLGNGVAGFSYGNILGNPTLRPERQSTFEVGVDARLFNDRVGFDISYYSIQSRDVIIRVPVAPSSGFEFFVDNAASLSNTGIEAIVNVTPVKTNGFRWDATFNFTRNRNEVKELAEGVDNVFLGGFTGASTYAVTGQAYSTIYGFGFYRDADGNKVIGSDGFPIIDPTERAFDSALPDWTLGFRNTFTYKGITLSALLDIKQGGVVWNGTKGALYFWGTHQETAEMRNTKKTFEGSNATYNADGSLVLDANGVPVTSGTNDQEVDIDEYWLAFGNGNGFFGDNTEDFIEDASWVRLRELSLSYQLPTSILGNKVKNLSIGFTGRNLFLSTPYTGVDPETNLYGASNAQGLDYFNMPGTKSYAINLTAKF